MRFFARYSFWIFVLFEHRNPALQIWIKVSQKSQKRCYNPSLSPPPYGGSCFSMLRQSVFVVWLVILFLLVHDEVNIREFAFR